jgi:hypothetical protein
MPAKRDLTMRQLRYMLRLHHDGVSARARPARHGPRARLFAALALTRDDGRYANCCAPSAGSHFSCSMIGDRGPLRHRLDPSHQLSAD